MTLKDDASENRIGLRRGTVQAKVARDARVKTVFKVSTPVATSSVRGTEQIISYGPVSGMQIYMRDGVAECQSNNGSSSVLRGGLVFQQKTCGMNPENPMGTIQGAALARIYDNYLSGDEKAMMGLLGSDLVGLPQGVIDRLKSLMGPPALVGFILYFSGINDLP
jgi:hypothetical protein